MGSASSFPTANAQVCLAPSSPIHGIAATADSAGSLRMWASSAPETLGWVSGLRYRASHSTSHTKPTEPVAMKAQRHPHVSAIQGTTSGVMIAPVLVPALKMPAARARSRFGNHSATVLIAPGKLADSPSPSSARAAENPAVVRAKAWPIAATLHATTATAKPRRTPTRSNSLPAARNPKAYTRLNQDTTSPYCDSDQCSSRCNVGARMPRDRKSTRLNSSHDQISYAVFCLKKKKKKNTHIVSKHLSVDLGG